MRRPAHPFRQSGNIFFALFGAVGLVGVLGASTMTIVKGPVRSMHTVTQRTIAENNMIAAGKLALMAATNQAQSGDCDADGTVEPVPFSATGTGPHPAGGGYLPDAIGAAKQDPWGNTYGYCAWDHGNIIKDGTCANDAGRLGGVAAEDGAVLAVISSGPDRLFQTSCADAPDYVVRAEGSDDVVQEYTYGEAVAGSGGLWVLKEGDPETATIDKDVEVDGAFRMGTAGEDPGQVGMAACTGGNHIGRMRFNPIDNAIEVCGYEGGAYGWETLAAAGGSVPIGTISAFDSVSCPNGWEPVTGLQGRMVMGAGGGYTVGDTGGAASVTLSAAQMPAHAHTVDPPNTGTTAGGDHAHIVDPPNTGTAAAGAHTHSANHGGGWTGFKESGGNGGFITGSYWSHADIIIDYAGNHAHTVDIAPFWSDTRGNHAHTVDIGPFASSNAGSGQAHENRPPFRAYLYCVYMGGADGAVARSFNDLEDVDTTGVDDNDILVWDEGAGQWLPEKHWVKDGTDLIYEGGNVGIGENWLSSDGDDEGIRFNSNGSVVVSAGHLITGSSNGALVFNSGPAGLNSETGFWFRANETLGEHVQPYDNLMRITADGNVGIGTTAPSAKLDILSPAGVGVQITNEAGASNLMLRNTVTGTPNLSFQHDSILMEHGTSAEPALLLRAGGSAGNGRIYFNVGSAGAMLIGPNGNVRIGTQSVEPAEKFYVDGSAYINGDLDMGTHAIENVLAPTTDNQAANKKYVDDAIASGVSVNETDPKVGSLENGKWCKSTGSVINCTNDLPFPPGDNLGNHTATQNINLASHKLVGNGGTEGITITASGMVQLVTAAAPALHVETSASGGRAVYGRASGGGSGVYGEATGASNTGVFGAATATTGQTFGGRFVSNSTGGIGVQGHATEASGSTRGGWFVSSSSSGRGVHAGANSATGTTYGVYSQVDSPDGSAIYGIASNGGYGLYSNGKAHVQGNLTVSGNMTATAYYQSSDRNLKTDIETIADPFTLLNVIEGKHFLWKDGGKGAYGVIAQDVETVMPEAIGENYEGYKTVEYGQLIAPLIEAVKQLDARVNALESDNDNLREEVHALKEGER